MPENAAAEGGYGLSAAEAFGGGIGSADSAPSPSAVGGTFGGFGDKGLPGSAPAQSGRYGSGTPTPGTAMSNALAQAQFAANSRAQAANIAAAIAQSRSLSSRQAAARAQEAMALKGRTSLGLPSLSRNTQAPALLDPITVSQPVANTVAQTSTTAPTNYSQKNVFGRIAQDISMGMTNPFASREQQTQSLLGRGYTQPEIDAYFDRTDATMARDRAAQENAPGGRDEVIVKKQDDTSGSRRDNSEMQYRRMLAERFGGLQAPQMQNPVPSMFGGKGARTILPTPGEVTPDMRREALRIFESQRGAGQIPYQMLPYQQGLGSMRRPNVRIPGFPGPRMPMPQPPMRQNPNVSPAFQYAAQNYQRLGGAQRLMDRPMEMMSVAERQRINEMAQGMADIQRPTMFSGKGSEIAAGGSRERRPEIIGRISPLIMQMGIAGLRGYGRPMSGMQNRQRSMQGINPSFQYII